MEDLAIFLFCLRMTIALTALNMLVSFSIIYKMHWDGLWGVDLGFDTLFSLCMTFVCKTSLTIIASFVLLFGVKAANEVEASNTANRNNEAGIIPHVWKGRIKMFGVAYIILILIDIALILLLRNQVSSDELRALVDAPGASIVLFFLLKSPIFYLISQRIWRLIDLQSPPTSPTMADTVPNSYEEAEMEEESVLLQEDNVEEVSPETRSRRVKNKPKRRKPHPF